ncbi:hypothetical protein ACIG5E_34165, partial [Kitasatospora sp. NPDC053057]
MTEQWQEPGDEDEDEGQGVRVGTVEDEAPFGYWQQGCQWCGKPIPKEKENATGRPPSYCTNNNKACLNESRASRARAANSPGLPGQLVRIENTADRLIQQGMDLRDAVLQVTSPQGVEARISAARAEAQTAIAQANAAAAAAQAAEAAAQAQAQAEREQAQAATAAAEQAEERRRTAAAQRDEATTDAAEAREAAEAAAAAQRVAEGRQREAEAGRAEAER